MSFWVTDSSADTSYQTANATLSPSPTAQDIAEWEGSIPSGQIMMVNDRVMRASASSSVPSRSRSSHSSSDALSSSIHPLEEGFDWVTLIASMLCVSPSTSSSKSWNTAKTTKPSTVKQRVATDNIMYVRIPEEEEEDSSIEDWALRPVFGTNSNPQEGSKGSSDTGSEGSRIESNDSAAKKDKEKVQFSGFPATRTPNATASLHAKCKPRVKKVRVLTPEEVIMCSAKASSQACPMQDNWNEAQPKARAKRVPMYDRFTKTPVKARANESPMKGRPDEAIHAGHHSPLTILMGDLSCGTTEDLTSSSGAMDDSSDDDDLESGVVTPSRYSKVAISCRVPGDSDTIASQESSSTNTRRYVGCNSANGPEVVTSLTLDGTTPQQECAFQGNTGRSNEENDPETDRLVQKQRGDHYILTIDESDEDSRGRRNVPLQLVTEYLTCAVTSSDETTLTTGDESGDVSESEGETSFETCEEGGAAGAAAAADPPYTVSTDSWSERCSSSSSSSSSAATSTSNTTSTKVSSSSGLVITYSIQEDGEVMAKLLNESLVTISEKDEDADSNDETNYESCKEDEPEGITSVDETSYKSCDESRAATEETNSDDETISDIFKEAKAAVSAVLDSDDETNYESCKEERVPTPECILEEDKESEEEEKESEAEDLDQHVIIWRELAMSYSTESEDDDIDEFAVNQAPTLESQQENKIDDDTNYETCEEGRSSGCDSSCRSERTEKHETLNVDVGQDDCFGKQSTGSELVMSYSTELEEDVESRGLLALVTRSSFAQPSKDSEEQLEEGYGYSAADLIMLLESMDSDKNEEEEERQEEETFVSCLRGSTSSLEASVSNLCLQSHALILGTRTQVLQLPILNTTSLFILGTIVAGDLLLDIMTTWNALTPLLRKANQVATTIGTMSMQMLAVPNVILALIKFELLWVSIRNFMAATPGAH